MIVFRALDIETVPDEAAWTRGAKYQVVPSPHCAHPDGSPVLTAQRMDEVAPPHACRVVAISCVDVGFDPGRESPYQLEAGWTDCRWGSDEEERALLLALAHAMASVQNVHLVTWNGRGFDLPVLAMRSWHHKIPAPWYYRNKDVRYRYSTEGHLDLMDFLADYGASRCMRLGDAARLVGLPGKTDMAGDQVSSLHERALAHPEEAEAIRARVARYCLQDTVQTALLFVSSLYLRGKITAETHDAAAATFRADPDVLAALDVDWDRFMVRSAADRPEPAREDLTGFVPDGGEDN